MGQLIMRWKNDGTAAREIVLPDGVKLKNFTEIKDAKSAWLNIVSFMGQGEAKYDGELYEKVMISQPHYDEKLCFFLCVEEVPAATRTSRITSKIDATRFKKSTSNSEYQRVNADTLIQVLSFIIPRIPWGSPWHR